MPRLNFLLDQILCHHKEIWLYLRSTGDGSSESYGTSEMFAAFLGNETTCHFCRRATVDLTKHLACSRREGLGFVVLEISYAKQAQLRNECEKETRRRKAHHNHNRRSALIKAGGVSHSKSEIFELYQVQDGRCYYCFSELIDNEGKKSFSRDHVEPLASEGTDSILNIVLACKACNSKKGWASAGKFDRAIRRLMPQNTKDSLRHLRVRVAQFRQKIKRASGSDAG
ncbi:HNH endonuclease [Uliginosibacterium sp. 31-12]|uniref:HNH endonuclease n=1 Tax=Uliginosibacterium sp. 31-12 TaxID=3062781 RepID=UPI0026E35ED4|nr:HNH endonuclease [Uliginosibacterium sp. 31-12]MDO6386518.1 HNH endonuclease [Uliginosibacterium sp. 31-12]